MVSTPGIFINDSPISLMTSTPVKKPRAQKSLCLLINILDVKKTATRQVGAAKYKRKAIKYGNTPWSLKKKQKCNSKINEQIKKSPYNCIMQHPQVVQSPIFNDCLKLKIDGPAELQLVPKLLLRVSVRELHNNLVSDVDNGGIKEERDEDDNIIISNSTLRSLLPPQFKNAVKIQDHVWFWMLHICQNYTFVITVMARSLFKKTQGYQPRLSKQKVWWKSKSHI